MAYVVKPVPTRREPVTHDVLNRLIEKRRFVDGRYVFDGSWISPCNIPGRVAYPGIGNILEQMLTAFPQSMRGGFTRQSIVATLRAAADVLAYDIEEQ